MPKSNKILPSIGNPGGGGGVGGGGPPPGGAAYAKKVVILANKLKISFFGAIFIVVKI